MVSDANDIQYQRLRNTSRTLLDLLRTIWVCQMLHETDFQIINMFSMVNIMLQSSYDTSYSSGGVNQTLILKKYFR
jgi:hypothetical protein